MNNRIEMLKEVWESENIANSNSLNDNEIMAFQMTTHLVIPQDMMEYFKQLNGGNGKYDNRFFRFYSFSDFKSVDYDLVNFKGVPDYRNIINTLPGFQSYYVFADYTFHLFTYAIRLHSYASPNNQVLALCSEKYKVIANSFSEFVDLYLDESIELQF